MSDRLSYDGQPPQDPTPEPKGKAHERLSSFIKEHGTLRPENAIKLALGIVANIETVHAKGLVQAHTDTPANILFDPETYVTQEIEEQDTVTPKEYDGSYLREQQAVAEVIYYSLTGKNIREIVQDATQKQTSKFVFLNSLDWENVPPGLRNIISSAFSLEGVRGYSSDENAIRNIKNQLQKSFQAVMPERDTILTADMPLDEINVLETQQIRSEVIACIRSGKAILYWGMSANGDDMIVAGAHNNALARLCKQVGIDPLSINLKRLHQDLTHERKYSSDRYLRSSFKDDDGYDLSLRVANLFGNLLGTPEMPNHYSACLQKVATTLNFLPAEGSELHIPQPLPIEGTPLEHFDKVEVKRRAEEIQSQAGKDIISIVQSGNEIKRLSNEDALSLAQLVRTLAPDSYIQIVSDQAFRRDAAPDNRFEEFADSYIASTDINTTAAHLYSSTYTIGTDSYWGWLSSGLQAMKYDGVLPPGKVALLYTIAYPETWAVTGAEVIASPVLQKNREINGSEVKNMMYLDTYYKLSGTPNKSGIAPADIQLLKEAIRNHFIKNSE